MKIEMDKIEIPINSNADYKEAGNLIRQAVIDHPTIPKLLTLKEVKKPYNYKLHKKLFALIDFAYKNTELPTKEYKGNLITQSKESFRKELIILSGFYKVDVTGKGDIRFIADSISYLKCPDSKKEKILDAMLDVVARLLADSGYTREKLEKLSEEWVKFV